MAEAFVNVTEGSGKKLHGWDRTIGANTVIDEVVLLGEPYLAAYGVSPSSVAALTNGDHLMQIMAGSSLIVRVHYYEIEPFALPAAAGTLGIHVFRLTTAGTGGTATTPLALDGSDAASGATCMTLPTVKGTEAATPLWKHGLGMVNAQPVLAGNKLIWPPPGIPNVKPIKIAAGTTNGIAFKLIAGGAATQTCVLRALITEANF